VTVDCAKLASRWRLADFYGRILIPPVDLPHRTPDFDAAIDAVRRAQQAHRLGDLIVVLERTGRYHLPLKRAFSAAGFDVRVVDPLATHHYRSIAHAGTKTDDLDLEALHQAAIHGFGLVLPEWPAGLLRLQRWARHRRDLVAKRTRLKCQIREHLHEMMPGFAELFNDIFECKIALTLPRLFTTATAVRDAGIEGLARAVGTAGVRTQKQALVRIVAWAQAAPEGIELTVAPVILGAELDDFQAKTRQIQAAEVAMASELVATPHLVLLSMPGANVVSVADFASEVGPMAGYAGGRAITGRCGLYPSRYQSGPVDRRDGPLVLKGNRRLRCVVLRLADSLLRCNDHFRVLGEVWKQAGVSGPEAHVRAANRFCRIAYRMVAGSEAYRHPSGQGHDYIIQKLIKFYESHDVGTDEIMKDLRIAVDHLPAAVRAGEVAPLEAERTRVAGSRGAGARRLGAILPPVLARLMELAVESEASGESSLSCGA
jgi:transposase